jgi:hypothetical protein
VLEELGLGPAKVSPKDRRADVPHQVEHKVQVVDCVQPWAKELARLVEVPQVRSREALAGVAAATLLNRLRISCILCLADVDAPSGSEHCAVAR